MSPDLERLVGRAVMDPAFREKLLADPEGAIKDSGLSLDPDQIDRVKKGLDRLKQNLTPEQIMRPFGPTIQSSWE